MYLKKSDLVEAMVNYYDNVSDFENDFDLIIEMIDSWDGYLGDDRYYSMDEFDYLMEGYSPLEIIEKINFREFNSCDSYFKYDIYGIESSDEKDYSAWIDDYFMGQLIDNDDYMNEINDYNYFDTETDSMIDLINLYNEAIEDPFSPIEVEDKAYIKDDEISDDILEFLEKFIDTDNGLSRVIESEIEKRNAEKVA